MEHQLKDVIHYYLPYDLQMYWEDLNDIPMTPWTLDAGSIYMALENRNTPLLRPLSKLTEEIEYKGEKFVPWDDLMLSVYTYSDAMAEFMDCLSSSGESIILEGSAPFMVMQKLFEWHFDVFGLIESNQAREKQ